MTAFLTTLPAFKQPARSIEDLQEIYDVIGLSLGNSRSITLTAFLSATDSHPSVHDSCTHNTKSPKFHTLAKIRNLSMLINLCGPFFDSSQLFKSCKSLMTFRLCPARLSGNSFDSLLALKNDDHIWAVVANGAHHIICWHCIPTFFPHASRNISRIKM